MLRECGLSKPAVSSDLLVGQSVVLGLGTMVRATFWQHASLALSVRQVALSYGSTAECYSRYVCAHSCTGSLSCIGRLLLLLLLLLLLFLLLLLSRLFRDCWLYHRSFVSVQDNNKQHRSII